MREVCLTVLVGIAVACAWAMWMGISMSVQENGERLKRIEKHLGIAPNDKEEE